MEPRPFQYMVQAAKGQQLSGSPDAWVRRVCTDSRQAQAGDLFVALTGERFDGHAFIPEVLQKRVAGLVVEQGKLAPPWPDCGVIAVESTRAAFGRIAARYRQDFSIPVLAVGGSNGKTTTKELLASVLGQRFEVLASRASFNNDIGVPATLLELDSKHQLAILEFGTNHPGELAPLLRLAGPQFGILTSIGREHLEFFGDLNGVMQEEGWLAEALPENGRLFINGDTPGAEQIVRRSSAPVTKVGLNAEYDWSATEIGMDLTGLRFRVRCSARDFGREFSAPILGRHQVTNVLLAIAVGEALGMSADEVQGGLAKFRPAKMRLQVWQCGGVQILDDSYNANADSMQAALQTLLDLPCEGRRIAVLGDMAELGTHSAEAHLELGREAARVQVDQLMAVGAWAESVRKAAAEAGLRNAHAFPGIEPLAQALQESVRPGDIVLLKASRATGIERVGELLRARKNSLADVDQGRSPQTKR